MRSRLKSLQKPSEEIKVRHEHLLYKLQLSVQHKRSTLVTELSTFEKQFFIKHCKLPQANDCPEREDIKSRCKHINKLLSVWKIKD